VRNEYDYHIPMEAKHEINLTVFSDERPLAWKSKFLDNVVMSSGIEDVLDKPIIYSINAEIECISLLFVSEESRRLSLRLRSKNFASNKAFLLANILETNEK
jgi:hypothetical protein